MKVLPIDSNRLALTVNDQRSILIDAVKKLANVAPKGTNPQGAFYEATVQINGSGGTSWATTIRWFRFANGDLAINTAFIP